MTAPIFFAMVAAPAEGEYAWAVIDPRASEVTAYGAGLSLAALMQVPRPDGAVTVYWNRAPESAEPTWRPSRGTLDFATLNVALEVFQPGNPPAVDPGAVIPRLLTMATVLRRWAAIFYLAEGKWK